MSKERISGPWRVLESPRDKKPFSVGRVRGSLANRSMEYYTAGTSTVQKWATHLGAQTKANELNDAEPSDE